MIRNIDPIKLALATSGKVDIKIGDYVNRSFSIFGQHWKNFVLFTIVSMLLTLVSAITIVGPYLLMFPLIMGYSNVIDKIENGQSYEFNDFFIGLKKWTSFIPLFILIILSVIVFCVPVGVIMGSMFSIVENNEEVAPFLGLSLFIIFPVMMFVGIFLSIICHLVPYFIYHGNLGAVKSLKLSYKVVKNNLWYMLLFVILFSIISQIGVYLCLIGIFASIPIGYILSYLMFKDLFLVDGKNEIDTIGQSTEL